MNVETIITSFAKEGHAFLSPSGASRWMECPGSAALSLLVSNPSSKAAKAGTQKHAQLERALIFGEKSPSSDIQRMVEIVDTFLANGYERGVEAEIKIGKALKLKNPDIIWGTADITLYNPAQGCLGILDAKFGQLAVSAKDNKQLLCYLTGYWLEWQAQTKQSFQKGIVGIMQPSKTPFFEITEYSFDEVQDFARQLKVAITAAETAATVMLKEKELPEVFLKPGLPQCRWCNCKPICSAYGKTKGIEAMENEALANEFSPPNLLKEIKVTVQIPPEAKHYADMTPDAAYAKALRATKEAKIIVDWFTKGLKDETLKSEKYKLVPMNRGSRIWTADASAETLAFLTGLEQSQLLVEPTLKTPSVLEQEIGEDAMHNLEQAGLIERKEPSKVVKPK
jgi:hypothetical protein